ncbi:unnamed protein product [Amoebophrya sp. A25]|nr:unnamed protein product [Amoebophrya sp. A25]|eukprot:GSA25T00004077001.1
MYDSACGRGAVPFTAIAGHQNFQMTAENCELWEKERADEIEMVADEELAPDFPVIAAPKPPAAPPIPSVPGGEGEPAPTPAAKPKTIAESGVQRKTKNISEFFTIKEYDKIWSGVDFWEQHKKNEENVKNWAPPNGLTKPPPQNLLRSYTVSNPNVSQQWWSDYYAGWFPEDPQSFPKYMESEDWKRLCSMVAKSKEDDNAFLPSSLHENSAGISYMAKILYAVMTEFLYQVAYPLSRVRSGSADNSNSNQDDCSYCMCLQKFGQVLITRLNPNRATRLDPDGIVPYIWSTTLQEGSAKESLYTFVRSAAYSKTSPILYYADNPEVGHRLLPTDKSTKPPTCAGFGLELQNFLTQFREIVFWPARRRLNALCAEVANNADVVKIPLGLNHDGIRDGFCKAWEEEKQNEEELVKERKLVLDLSQEDQ